MSLQQNFTLLAKYNQRMNQQLLSCCFQLSPEQLNQDTRSFFPSILSYWNHLLFGDLILLGRLAENNVASLSINTLAEFPKPKAPTDIYVKTLDELKTLREKLDNIITEFVEQLTENDCQYSITYTTTENKQVTQTVAVICQHIFNHQAHHRGQLTCLLSQYGIHYGCTDFPVIIA